MTPVDNTQTIEISGPVNSIGKITVTSKNIPFLINAVTDRIYKDKAMAIIREYSTNAADAHIVNHLPINDIQVFMPTLKYPVFRVRDFGTGLTMEQIRDVYCILGESTKRNSNDLNGMLGLGCKSAMGYGDSFTVTSWVNGEKAVYNIIKGDDHKEGDVLEMVRVPMVEGDRTGIEIAVPIKISDLHTIHAKAADLYKYWTVLPTINNMEESELSRLMAFRNETAFLSGDGWEIRPNSNHYGNGKSVAVMGQVAYPVDWNMLNAKLALTPQKRIFLEILRSNDVVLQFPIGALKFTINREELEYTETTYRNLEDKIETIFTALESSVKQKFVNAKSIWEAKRIYLSLFGKNLLDKYNTEDDDDDEKNKTPDVIKVLDGDFYRLEDMFRGKLVWNGVTIDEPHFSQMNHWDCDRPDREFKDVVCPSIPCLISYRLKKTRVKRLACTDKDNNRITPYNDVKIVILDGRYMSQATAVAQYFLLRSESKVRKVHILRFANDAQKEKFFAHYHFDTAEYVNVSTIIDEVKTWKAANRKSYGRGGGGAMALVKYIDVANEEVKEEEMSLRDLEDGGVYVAMQRKYSVLKTGQQIRHHQLANYINQLAEYCGEEIDRIYLIPEGKCQAKWFQNALSEGLWVEISDFIKENVEVVVTDEMKQRYHYQKFLNNNRGMNLPKDWVDAIIEKLSGSSPLFNDFSNEIVANPDDFCELTNSLSFFGLPALNFGRSPTDYNKSVKEIRNTYPMIQFMNIGQWDSVQKNKLKAIVEYIELVDSQKKMLTTAPELV